MLLPSRANIRKIVSMISGGIFLQGFVYMSPFLGSICIEKSFLHGSNTIIPPGILSLYTQTFFQYVRAVL